MLFDTTYRLAQLSPVVQVLQHLPSILYRPGLPEIHQSPSKLINAHVIFNSPLFVNNDFTQSCLNIFMKVAWIFVVCLPFLLVSLLHPSGPEGLASLEDQLDPSSLEGKQQNDNCSNLYLGGCELTCKRCNHNHTTLNRSLMYPIFLSILVVVIGIQLWFRYSIDRSNTRQISEGRW